MGTEKRKKGAVALHWKKKGSMHLDGVFSLPTWQGKKNDVNYPLEKTKGEKWRKVRNIKHRGNQRVATSYVLYYERDQLSLNKGRKTRVRRLEGAQTSTLED